MTRDPKWFGNLLRDLRQKAGYSLDGVEARSGISGVVVGSYERCDRRPSVERAERLLDFYGWQLTVAPKGYDVQALVAENAKLRAFCDEWIGAAEARGLVVRRPLAVMPDERAA